MAVEGTKGLFGEGDSLCGFSHKGGLARAGNRTVRAARLGVRCARAQYCPENKREMQKCHSLVTNP